MGKYEADIPHTILVILPMIFSKAGPSDDLERFLNSLSLRVDPQLRKRFPQENWSKVYSSIYEACKLAAKGDDAWMAVSPAIPKLPVAEMRTPPRPKLVVEIGMPSRPRVVAEIGPPSRPKVVAEIVSPTRSKLVAEIGTSSRPRQIGTSSRPSGPHRISDILHTFWYHLHNR